MSSFSQRMGFVNSRFEPQVDDLDSSTRMALWNRIHGIEETIHDTYGGHAKMDEAVKKLWRDTMERDLKKYSYPVGISVIRSTILESEWHASLSMLEDFLKAIELQEAGVGVLIGERFNETVLEDFLVGYRFIGLTLSPVSSPEAVSSVNTAIENSQLPISARSHLEKSVSLLSSRDNPNYGKSMDEALEAVESAVHAITGKKVLSEGLKSLKRNGKNVHPALLQAWEKMYAWASDEGIRHAEFESVPKDQATAIYVLVTSSAFVNYLASATNVTPATE